MVRGFRKLAQMVVGGVCLVALLDGCALKSMNYAPLASIKADPPPVQKVLRADQISAAICRQWSPESRAMLEMLYTT